MSLDDLLEEAETSVTNRNEEKITLEDLMKINLHNRKMTLLLIGGLVLFLIYVMESRKKGD